MSGESNQSPSDRRKRVQTLKKLILLILATSIIIPWICCVILFVQVRTLRNALQETTGRMEEVSSLFLEQQNLLDIVTGEADSQGDGAASPDEGVQGSIQADYDITKEGNQDATDSIENEMGHKVYLTFDDGPSIYTEDILNILDRYGVKATFFVVGKEDEASREALNQIVERGHSLGMHSYSHKYREIYESADNFADDFVKIQNYLYDVTGVKSSIYRFPGGSSNQVSKTDMQELANYLQMQNVTFYDWNISSGDGSSEILSVRDIVDNCMRDIENWETSIILLHDSGDKRTTVEALPIIIENILAMEDTDILPITEETKPVQHINTIVTNAKE